MGNGPPLVGATHMTGGKQMPLRCRAENQVFAGKGGKCYTLTKKKAIRDAGNKRYG